MVNTFLRRLLLGVEIHRIDSKAPFVHLEGAFFGEVIFGDLNGQTVFLGEGCFGDVKG